MDQFIMGAVTMACWVAGLFFLRFWRDTRDRLFVIFGLAFWLLGLIRLLLVFTGRVSETTSYLYWVRFAAYLLILLAVVDKNLPRSRGHAPPADDAERVPPT